MDYLYAVLLISGMEKNHLHACICRLTLEWNDLGLIENSFSVFCDGVGASGTLAMLDLRSNQITHVGAAELAAALKRNSSLQTLGISSSCSCYSMCVRCSTFSLDDMIVVCV